MTVNICVLLTQITIIIKRLFRFIQGTVGDTMEVIRSRKSKKDNGALQKNNQKILSHFLTYTHSPGGRSSRPRFIENDGYHGTDKDKII